MYGQCPPEVFATGCPPHSECSTRARSRLRGFSLIEVVAVVAIIAILAVIATPAFTDLLRRNRLSAASTALQVSLNLARSEAVKRGGDSRVIVAANGAAGQWTNGWTVFVDLVNDGTNKEVAPADDGDAKLVRLEVADAPAGPINAGPDPAAMPAGALKSFTYDGRGRLIDPTTAGVGVVARSVWFFDGASEKYCLIVNNSSRVRAARVATGTSCPSN